LAEFHHFGVPTLTKHEGETFIEGAKVHVTDPAAHPFKIEFVRCEPDCPMPEIVQTTPHAAFMVPDIEAALEGCEVVVPPTDVSESLRIAFVKSGEALIELMQAL